MIVLLTLSPGERKSLLFGRVNWSMERHLRVTNLLRQENYFRFLKRVLILSVMMYSVSNHCVLPLHLALADVVDSYSGSEELLMILNRLGVTSSKETLQRFQVAHASAMQEKVLSDCVQPGAFVQHQ